MPLAESSHEERGFARIRPEARVRQLPPDRDRVSADVEGKHSQKYLRLIPKE